MILDIDSLRKDHKIAPYYHGLGMVRLIMPDCTLNFHGALIPPEAHYIHSHRRNFTSTCLFGEVKNIYYNYEVSDKPTEYVLEEIDCKEGEEQRLVHKDINLIYHKEIIQRAGDVVDHYWKDIHDFECLSEHACTKVLFGKIIDVSYIVRDKKEDYLCALSNKGEADESWDIINGILQSQKKG